MSFESAPKEDLSLSFLIGASSEANMAVDDLKTVYGKLMEQHAQLYMQEQQDLSKFPTEQQTQFKETFAEQITHIQNEMRQLRDQIRDRVVEIDGE